MQRIQGLIPQERYTALSFTEVRDELAYLIEEFSTTGGIAQFVPRCMV